MSSLNISLPGFFSNPVSFFFCICTPHCTCFCSPAWKRTLHLLFLPLWKPVLSSGRSESHASLTLIICTVTLRCWNSITTGAHPCLSRSSCVSFQKTDDGRRGISAAYEFVSKDDFLHQTERKGLRHEIKVRVYVCVKEWNILLKKFKLALSLISTMWMFCASVGLHDLHCCNWWARNCVINKLFFYITCLE